MRLEINLKFDEITLPIDTQSIIQGWIYHSLDKDRGEFYHNKGYQLEHRKFKMFTFSKLIGKYEINNKEITFYNTAKFYISSLDSYFIKNIYDTIQRNEIMQLQKYRVLIDEVKVFNNEKFKSHLVSFSSLSALCVYQTDENRFVHYYSPFDIEFEKLIIKNISNKYEAYFHKPWQGHFRIVSFKLERKGIYSFKNIKIKGYFLTLKIEADETTLSIIYETGIGMKNSSGFGMLKLEK